jgi:DNA-binding beta-propeller fold protein YncE
VAAVFGRPGLMPGPHRFEARFDDVHGVPVAGSPAVFTVTAGPPAVGTIFTAVNADRIAGAVPGPGPFARVGQLGGVVAASDGSIYFADRTQHVIWRLSPRGAVSVVAGSRGLAGWIDGAPTMARFNAPHGIALDPPQTTLYVADRSNHRVRAIALATGAVSTVAGNGTTGTVAPFGDGAGALMAQLSSPSNVAVDAMGMIYVSDNGHNRIRRIDPVLGLIYAWEGTGGAGPCTSPVVFHGCASAAQSCHVIFESDGTAYISGYICGNVAPLTTSVVYGIIRRATDGTFTHVAGRTSAGGMTAEGAPAVQTYINALGWISRAPDGALHYVEQGTHRIRRIDPATGAVTTIVGMGGAGSTTGGFAGEYVTAIAAQMNVPWGFAFSAGHIFVADASNTALRVIW